MKTHAELPGDGGSRIVEQVTAQMNRLTERMKRIQRKIAVVSGKGGVGKTVVTAGMATALARKGFKVGVLDADINGSSIPLTMGLKNESPVRDDNGIAPLTGPLGVKVMSIDFLLEDSDAHLRWRGPTETFAWLGAMEATALRELLTDTLWGDLDFLLVDTPPALSRLNDLRGFVPDLDGAVLVTIPSAASQRITLKTITRLQEIGVPILGVVENFSGYACKHCGGNNQMFDAPDMDEAFSYLVPLLGRTPLYHDISSLFDRESGDGASSPPREKFEEICESVVSILNSANGGKGGRPA